jgi:hypothetical protein
MNEALLAGGHVRSQSTVSNQSPARSPMSSTSPPRLPPGSHSAAAAARRQQRIAEQLAAHPPEQEEVVPIVGTGKKLSMAKLAELSRPRIKIVEEPTPPPEKPPPKRRAEQLAAHPPEHEEVVPIVGTGKKLSMAKLTELSRPKIKIVEEPTPPPEKPPPKRPAKLLQTQSRTQQPPLAPTQPPPKVEKPPQKTAKPPAKPVHPQTKLTQLQSKQSQLQSKIVKPPSRIAPPSSKPAQVPSQSIHTQSKLSQLRKPGTSQPSKLAKPALSPELQAMMAQAKQAQSLLERYGVAKDVTNGTTDSQGKSQQHSAAAAADSAQSEEGQAAGLKKPSGLFGAFSSLWRKSEAGAIPFQNETVPHWAEQQQQRQQHRQQQQQQPTHEEQHAAHFAAPAYMRDPQVNQGAPPPTGHVATGYSEFQDHIMAEGALRQHTLQQPHTNQPYATHYHAGRPRPPSATAPFATDDTPANHLSSSTRPSQNAVLPQQVFPTRPAYTAPAPHHSGNVSQLQPQQQGVQPWLGQGAVAQQPPFVSDAAAAELHSSAKDSRSGELVGLPMLPAASATAPFATEDTPVHIVTSITRPSQNSALPQRVLSQNHSYTSAQLQLLSLPHQQEAPREGSMRSVTSARRPHPMESISFLQHPQQHEPVAAVQRQQGKDTALAESQPASSSQPADKGVHQESVWAVDSVVI